MVATIKKLALEIVDEDKKRKKKERGSGTFFGCKSLCTRAALSCQPVSGVVFKFLKTGLAATELQILVYAITKKSLI